jgi:hypothetical protein
VPTAHNYRLSPHNLAVIRDRVVYYSRHFHSNSILA